MSRAMESRVFLVDVSQTMGADLELAKKAILSITQQKIFQMAAKTRSGLVMMGSTDTKHSLGLEGYDNVCVVRDVEQTDLAIMEACNNLGVEEEACSYASGLTVAMDMLIKMEGNGKQDRGLYLVSNGKADVDEDDQNWIEAMAVSIHAKGLQLTVLGINFSASDDENDWAEGEAVLRKLVVRSGGVLKVVCNESESHEAAVKSVNPVTIFRGDFEFAPDLRLKVWAYPATKQQSMPSLKRRVKGGGAFAIDRKTVLVEPALDEYGNPLEDDEVKSEDITKAFKYGKDIVPLSDEDIHQMEMQCPKGMKLICTIKRNQILQHHLMSNADIIVHDRDQPQPSGKMLRALAEALEETSRVAIVNWVKRANGVPTLYVFYPLINKQDNIYGFHACRLPFSDDIRPWGERARKVPSTAQSRDLADRQLSFARSVITHANLADSSSSSSSNLKFVPGRCLPNPAIQNFNQIIVNKAMNFDVHSSQDLFLPLKAMSYGWWETMTTGKEEMDELFPVKWSKDDPVEEGNEGNEDKEKEGDQGQASSKRQRTEIESEDTQDEKSVHVKRQDADEIDLDIDFGNMSKSGRLNGGGDAVAQFEHDWKEDRDQAIENMRKRIEELVDKAIDERPLSKAVGLLEKLRKQCDPGHAFSDEPAKFNTAWKQLEDKYCKNTAIAFWEKVLAKGSELGRFQLGDDADAEEICAISQPAAAAVDLGLDEDEVY